MLHSKAVSILILSTVFASCYSKPLVRTDAWASKTITYTNSDPTGSSYQFVFNSDHKVALSVTTGPAQIEHPSGTWQELPSAVNPTYTQVAAPGQANVLIVLALISTLHRGDSVSFKFGDVGDAGSGAIVTSVSP